MNDVVLPDDAIVVRGGNSTPEMIAKSISTHPIGVSGLAAVSAPDKTILDLARTVPHRTIRTSRVGDIRRAGGDVIPAEGRSPFHAIIVGWRSVYNISGDEGEARPQGAESTSKGALARLFVDFNNADKAGRVRLNTKGAERDIDALHLVLSDGMQAVLNDGDEIAINGIVRYCPVEGWVAEIDWKKIEGE